MKLNLGCGKNILEGWTNVDEYEGPGVELIRDLDDDPEVPLVSHGTVNEFLLSHVLEHLDRPLWLFERMWHAATDGALCTVRCPYGSSDDAWEDPTHARPYYLGSFGYFGQPHYWRASYDYHGDWRCDKIQLYVSRRFEGSTGAEVLKCLQLERNVVIEMVAELRAVKPARAPRRELQVAPTVNIEIAELG